MAECTDCGHDQHKTAAERERRVQGLMLYRKALYIACEGSEEKVQEFIQRAMEELIDRAAPDAELGATRQPDA